VIDDESYNWGHGHVYDTLGIEPSQGAVIVARPDQYVSMITRFDVIEKIRDFFAGVLLNKQLNL
jgi:phenol 2-monooxygenase